jgi:hypothetical protein
MDVDIFRVGRGDLESIEEESGAARVELIGGEGLDDLDERELDGGAVFDGREFERDGFRGVVFGCFALLRMTRRLCAADGAASDGAASLVDDFFGRGKGAIGEAGLAALRGCAARFPAPDAGSAGSGAGRGSSTSGRP